MSGHTDVSTIGGETGPNFLGSGDNQFDLVRAGWKYVPTTHLLVETHAAFMDESFHERNFFAQPLSSENYGEWIAGTRSTWNWLSNQVLETGYTARRIRDSGSDPFLTIRPAHSVPGGFLWEHGPPPDSLCPADSQLLASAVARDGRFAL